MEEILLSHAPADGVEGERRALVSTYGASLRRYCRVGRDGVEEDIVWGYSGTPNKRGGQGDVLIPFPGRVKDGRYRFEGAELQMRRNDKDGPNAIHGFVRASTWDLVERAQGAARFKLRLREQELADAGYPFSLDVEVAYALSDAGLRCDFAVTNIGRGTAPVGAGFHPYFTVGTASVDEAEARIPARAFIEFGPDLLPTGRRLEVGGTPLDFRARRGIGATRFNHCYADLERDAEGIATAELLDPVTGRRTSIWMDRAFDYLVVYTGDAIPAPHARRALALEPMTCATDAFNRPEWGLIKLSPGACLSGSWGVS